MVYINAYAYLLAFDNETGLVIADAIKHNVTIRRAWRWLERLASVLQSARASGRLVLRTIGRNRLVPYPRRIGFLGNIGTAIKRCLAGKLYHLHKMLDRVDNVHNFASEGGNAATQHT